MPASQTSAPTSPFGAQAGAGQVGPPKVTVRIGGQAYMLSPGHAARVRRVAAVTFIVPLVVVAVGFFSYHVVAGGGGSDAPVEVAVGVTARVQSFEATVRSVDCDKQSITRPGAPTVDDPTTSYDDTGAVRAEGKFCVVAFSVKNVGEKTGTYPTYDLEATNATERVLDSDLVAEDYLNNGKHPLSEPIDPGNVVDQLLVYDVPLNTNLAYLRISSDLSGSTVKVKIS